MKYVIIGGVAAGTTAAAQIKRNEPDAEVILFDKEHEVSSGMCGVPYVYGGTIENVESLYRSPDEFEKNYGIIVKAGHEVTEIDIQGKQIKGEAENPFEESYDRLLLATGAKATQPPIPGVDLDHVFALRTMDDAKRLDWFLENKNPKTAAIMGTGFIGLEMTENLIERGMEVTVIARSGRVASHLDEDMSSSLIEVLEENGVTLKLEEDVEKFTKEGVMTNHGLIPADLIVTATGVKANTELAEKAGLAVGKFGIIVNRKMETSHKDIYAAGDCIEMIHQLDEKPTFTPLGTTANKTGKIAGSQMTGGTMQWKGILGTSIFRLFNLSVASTGFSEKVARDRGFDIITKTWEKNVFPSYWKENGMKIKAVADKQSKRLLGVQIIGEEGVDKRIDVAVSILTNQMSGEEIYNLDLAYAPPYNSVNDPIHYIGLWMMQEL